MHVNTDGAKMKYLLVHIMTYDSLVQRLKNTCNLLVQHLKNTCDLLKLLA
jgi:hypothetical protein